MKNPKKKSIRKKIIFRVFAINIITLFVVLVAMYFTLLPELNNRSILNAQSINKQIMQETETYLSSYKEYTNQIIYNDSFSEAFENYFANPDSEIDYNLVNLELNSFANIKGNIKYIVVETEDQQRFTSISVIGENELNILQSEWYMNIKNTDYANGISNPYILGNAGQDINYMAAYCKSFYIGTHKLTITVFFKINEIFKVTDSLMGENLDSYMWINNSSGVIYSNAKSESDSWYSEILNKLVEQEFYSNSTFESFGGYNFVTVSDNSYWTLASYISYGSLFITFRSFLFLFVFLIIIMFILSVTLLTPTITRITRPVSRLALTMSKVAQGDLNVVSKIETKDEIEELSVVFNKMVFDIKDYISKLIEKENMEQRMKYSLLISQIDPHFIYNTMNTINYLARKERYTDIVAINSALIKILQDRLRVNNIEIFDTVEYEINIVEQYIVIQNYRYGDSVDVHWEVDESILKVEIPKNIIQPLVENALFHGLTDEEDGQIHGKIVISIQREDDFVIIKVSDDGRGIDQEELQKLKKTGLCLEPEFRGKHIGLANIRERLLYLYGDEDCIDIESQLSQGTIVTLKLKKEHKSDIQFDSL